MYRCLACAPGCDTCVDSSPCLYERKIAILICLTFLIVVTILGVICVAAVTYVYREELVRIKTICACLVCRFPLLLGVWKGLRFLIVALPGLFSYSFFFTLQTNSADDKLIFLFAQKIGFDISCNRAIFPVFLFSQENRIWYSVQNISFQENKIWHFMQIVSWGNNLHDLSNPILREKWETIFLKWRPLIFLQACYACK